MIKFNKPSWWQRLWHQYCPKCNYKISWNEGWLKWENCDNCADNPNYTENNNKNK